MRATTSWIVIATFCLTLIASAPGVSASHLCSEPADETYILNGFWDSPVPAVDPSGIVTATYSCSSTTSTTWSLTANYQFASSIGTWACTKEIDSSSGTATTGIGSATQLAIFHGSTSGAGGGCSGTHFSSGNNAPDLVVYSGSCVFGSPIC